MKTHINIHRWLAAAILVLPVPMVQAQLFPSRPVVNEKELLINDIAVVNSTRATDPQGPWHIRTLMSHLAKKADPSAFVLSLLSQWETQNLVNRQLTDVRANIRSLIINPWIARSKAAGLPPGTLDFTTAPFRLLAIVNRMDLRSEVPDDMDAGEGRFVFCTFDVTTGNPHQFTFILEYRLVASSKQQIMDWAKAWHHLGSHTAFDEPYLDALATVTDRFAGSNAVLNQLRTNENALNSTWQLREFQIGSDGFLKLVTPKQTPPNTTLMNQNLKLQLAQFINFNADKIRSQTHEVPELFAGAPFLGAVVNNPFPTTASAWNVVDSIVDNETRHLFSLNTCNGCHGVETRTGTEGAPNFFTHIRPRLATAASTLSHFLTGTSANGGAPDPIVPATIRQFNDLDRRKTDLENLLNGTAQTLEAARTVGPAGPRRRPSRVH
ncbi:MAG: hypothetical protein JNJ83_09535 [Verrucomicrobiaceae bacterium]|nr:hypothetical protein [Verrucomicrobiaceae bacterium]